MRLEMSVADLKEGKSVETSYVEDAGVSDQHFFRCSPINDDWRAREKRLVRKLDCTLMPTIWVLYLFNYLDRNNIA